MVLKDGEDTVVLAVESREISLSMGVRSFVELNTGSNAREEYEEAQDVSSIDLSRFFLKMETS